MIKLKTKKSAQKRFKKTATGQFLHRHSYKGHLLMKKTNKQKRKLSQFLCVHTSDSKSIKLMLPY